MMRGRRYPLDGGSDEGGGGGGQDASSAEAALEGENERKLGYLSAKVSAIRDVAHSIQSSVRTSTVDVESLETEMGGARALLGTAGRQLRALFGVGSSGHMCWLALFVFLVLVLLYFLIRQYRARGHSQ
jgi:hypothetical protein